MNTLAAPVMKRGSTAFLQAVIVLVGIGVLAAMLFEPQVEGRNAHATQFEIYFHDPFLAYAYLSSIPFFVALYQGFTLLTQVARNDVFSGRSLRAIRTIKYCAISLVASIAGAEAFLFIVQRSKPEEDIAGGVAVGLFLMFASAVIATAAAVFERLLQNAVDLKFENDLTV